MPGKARHKKRKPSIPGRKRSDQPNLEAAIVSPPAVTQNRVMSTPPRAAVPQARATIVPYSHVATELWTIGILTVIMLAILFVLAIVPLPW